MTRRLLLLAALALAAGTVRADRPGPRRAEVLALAERVADWQLAHPSERWTPLLWHNAAFYAGVLALAEISPSPRFHDRLRALGEQHGWALAERPYHADDHAVGQAWAELFLRHGDPRMIAPLRERFDFILAHPKDDNLDFDRERNPDRLDRWSWCDALFMAPPAWVRLWKATGDARYLDFAVAKWWVTSDYLYDRESRLYFRDSRYFSQREANGAKVFWSRGNGWVLAGLVRLLQHLPADHPSRPRFEQQFREMAAAVLAAQQPDGLWRASLLDPASFPMKESSGSGFFCYAFAWGANEGLLDRAAYGAAALRAWDALAGFVQPDGKLTHVQPVGFTPVTFDASHTEPYGVGAFLLAAREVHRLVSP
ncbi:MAG TPA: glycoside hydrolase family 88 protein [Opitutaceae bacterium]|nr:glycoside hydrolase family 88 protein [Opitutaceae bacterium]